MTVDFIISIPGAYTGDPACAFDYDAVAESIRSSVSDLKTCSATCVHLRPNGFVLRVANPDSEQVAFLRRVSSSISLSVCSIDKPSHLAPEYRFAVVYDYDVA